VVSRTGAELWRAWGDVTLMLGLAIGALVFRRSGFGCTRLQSSENLYENIQD